MDLDRTIIDESYQITDKNIFGTLKDAKRLMVIGLNSDTPIISLRQWRSYLRIGHTGPLIAERGAILEVQGKKHFVSKARFASFKKNVIQAVQEAFPGTKIALGDVTQMLIEKQKFLDCSKAVMINDYRECSFSCYLRVIDDSGQPVIDHNWSDNVLRVIKNVVLPLHVDKPFYDPEYGIFIINAIDTIKSSGAKVLLSKNYHDYKLFMVGDSMSDYLEEIAVHCAVNNAKDAFKEKSSFVAKSKYTSGVIECINWIKALI